MATSPLLSSASMRLQAFLPKGERLPDDRWRQRHRALTATLWLHLPALTVLGLIQGETLSHVGLELAALAGCALLAMMPSLGRRWRVVATVTGLVGCSSLLVHFTNGLIESHFHFFVIVPVIMLYQEWTGFLVALSYVVLHHGVIGVLAPRSVYNHEAAWNKPVLWALIHGAYVLLASVANMVAWRSEEDRYQTERILDAAGDGIYGVDQKGLILFANPMARAIVGDEQLVGRHHHEVFRHSRQNGLPYDAEACLICKDVHDAATPSERDAAFAPAMLPEASRSPLVAVEYTVRPLVERQGRVGSVVSFRDITERREFEDRLRDLAMHDPLTGLANRTLLMNDLGHAVARTGRRGETMAVFLIDLDRFKLINDSLGHPAGDAVLQIIATRLSRLVRPSDTVARLGGDEFALLVEGLSAPTDVADLGERLLATVRAPITVDGRQIFVSTSIGICTRQVVESAEEPLRDADVALYRAKDSGGGRYVVFDELLRQRTVARFRLESELHRAFENGEFEVHYQPKVRLDNLCVAGLEALVRWRHPERGLIGPNDFIPMAEETGVIVPLGEWVMAEACHQLDEWIRRGVAQHLSVAVNLSARQIAHPCIVEMVHKQLRDHSFAPSQLHVEVTETAVMQDIEVAIGVLQRLHDSGVGIALDDFGTGYSSLSYLQRFPVDELKIDRSFVSGLGQDSDHASIAAAIISLARALGLSTVAEGVEEPIQMECLRELGCDLAQGFLFAPAGPPEEIEALLRAPMASASLEPQALHSA